MKINSVNVDGERFIRSMNNFNLDIGIIES